MSKIYLLFCICAVSLAASPDCSPKFECHAVKVGENEYSLEIELKSGDNTEYTFLLNDLNTGNQVSKQILSYNVGDRKVVFTKVRPSSYVVYYSTPSCPTLKAIPGKGIILQ
jgi:hypothetical protein